MILESFDGCTSGGSTIDNKCITKYSEKELREIIKYIADNLKKDELIEFITSSIESFAGDESYSEYCETCGDSSRTSVWKI